MAAFMLVTLTMASGCESHQTDQSRVNARGLYTESLKTITLYSDSMLHAKDSATVERLNEGLDEALTRLNSGYPPETDFSITEGENDTLSVVTRHFIEIRDSLLTGFAGVSANPADSVPADSLITP